MKLLGDLSPRAFLQRHWQKRPLFVRGAFPGFRGVFGETSASRALLALAERDDTESRMVQRRAGRRETIHGPFKRASLRKSNATLLVSGVNLHVRAADELLRRFDFIPQARLDDVMVSYATPGGGVGPHVDSYDVFLLQGAGRRQWRVWDRKGALFGEYMAQAGDLLYLPPGWKHDGVALDACTTYSIGFRAPRGAELGAAFLDWLHERGLPDAAYRDPALRPAARAARLPREMVAFAGRVLRRIRWTEKDAALFLGRYLTEPKAHIVFRPSRTRGRVVALDPKTQLLYSGRHFFINGETLKLPERYAKPLRLLADRRALERRQLAGPMLRGLISGWLRAGYARLERIQR